MNIYIFALVQSINDNNLIFSILIVFTSAWKNSREHLSNEGLFSRLLDELLNFLLFLLLFSLLLGFLLFLLLLLFLFLLGFDFSFLFFSIELLLLLLFLIVGELRTIDLNSFAVLLNLPFNISFYLSFMGNFLIDLIKHMLSLFKVLLSHIF